MSGRYVLPPRWLNCPRKSGLIADKFVAIKTPLDKNYSDKMKPGQLWTPTMALQAYKSQNVNIGLWIDLTNTNRFYNKEIVEKEIKYVKIECRGHGECPSPEQTRTFVNICHQFFCKEPMKKILVHCTHGFNRTGFLISAYLVERQDWSIEASVREFAKCRHPGIYKGDYLETLFSRFGDVEDAPPPPELPDWCNEEEDGDDEVESGYSSSSSSNNSSNSNNSNKRERTATFMEGVDKVYPADSRIWSEIQRKCQEMCKWSGRGFPGSQPVSLDWKNIQLFNRKPYSVSWKADGTRYMMLIDGPDRIYFIDRDNSVFQAREVRFPRRKDLNAHLSNTLLDGEMIIDEHNGQKTPRYLIYDIVKFEGIDVGWTHFNLRRTCITKEIIGPREEAKQTGLIDRSKEPFGIRIKDFWDIKQTKSIFGPSFTQQLSHEIDGLIFQPYDDPYKPGQCAESLKWKPETHNSIDFRCKIVAISKPGELNRKECYLYVNRMNEPYSSMPFTRSMKDLDGKIIECTWDYGKNCWKFMRIRTDKSFPNAYETANSVMETIRNPISKDRLLDFIERIPLFNNHHHHQQQQHHHQQHQNHNQHNRQQQKRPYPSDSSDDRNLMPPPNLSGSGRDTKRSKIS
ncbi:mRNA-capping enzyme-like [Panonychus citri]|uniref:mRNA-capping enzyme-like n=1 Tax=Panonychus citri TaxID=50023 RepID=UPI002307D79D|nr:mRNA-capping enzyme-like [Panonychus citri]